MLGAEGLSENPSQGLALFFKGWADATLTCWGVAMSPWVALELGQVPMVEW